MVLLGCVTEVRSSYLLVSLPGCVVGRVPITNISETFTEMLLRSTSEEDVDMPDLSSVVEVGATYPFKVLKVTFKDNSKRKPGVTLSMDPRAVNSELRMQSLYPRMLLHVSVVSVEDHGHIVDLGIPSVQGFIPFSASNGVLTPGQIVHASVTRLPSPKDGNVAWLSRVSSEGPFPEIDDENIALTSILPGAKVTAYITEVKQPFVHLKCMSFSACANMMSMAMQNVSEATKVAGTVLYVHPLSHVVYLHLGPLPTPSRFAKFFRHRNFDFVKNVKFEYFWHHRMLFSMGKGAPFGFIQKGNLPGRGFLSQDALAQNPVIPKARVTFLHYMDNLVQLSLAESTINMEVIKPDEVQVGDIYECNVSLHVSNGMFVAICPGLSGFVRHTHLSDALATSPPMFRWAHCQVQGAVCGRRQVHPGDSYKGVVVSRTDRHMVVIFFNAVKGIVYSEEIPEASVYFVGQTVTCRVLECNAQQERLKLSLRSESTVVRKQAVRPRTKSLPDNEQNIEVKSLVEDALKAKKPLAEDVLKKEKLASDELETELDPSKKCKATIQSTNRHQLNVVLRGGKRGRVHVTEIGVVEEGSLPLKGFKPFQALRVHVLGSHLAKARTFLEISHRRFKEYRECSLDYPPPVPLHMLYKKGMEVMGYVKEANNTSCSVWLSPMQIATLEYLHFSENPKELRKLKKQLKPGLALKARVLEVEKIKKEKQTYYNITLTRLDGATVQPGRNVVGLVQVASPEKGVVLRLPHGCHGVASLCDLRDEVAPLQGTLERCRRLLYVHCHLVEVKGDFCTLSLKKSRLYGVTPKTPLYPELTLSTLTRYTITTGYVASRHPRHLLVNFGRGLDGCVRLHSCDTRGCAACKETRALLDRHPPGEPVEVKVEDVKATKGLYPLSMPEIDGLGLSALLIVLNMLSRDIYSPPPLIGDPWCD
ncbi:hypothetical protein JTE90_003489 [Oedothorax gibbosus]|uniref:S1 motif domain-containing protein n=1 Tax=Oedothorax gibbosus TaxID=931172 RepID=A0AAV6UGQ6_9ARAC|nr:hypothetical protein JTE90_003489 [Oedothorax gibbosus]